MITGADMQALKTAVIGTNIGVALHIRALTAAGFEVTHLLGRDAERTASRAAHFGIPNAATRLEAALESDVEAIVVATPPQSHHPIVMSAIAAGKHVLCEKPLATTLDLAREMCAAAASSGIVAVLQHQFRWRPDNALLRQIVQRGDLGALIQGTFTFDCPMTQNPGALDVPDWWLEPATGGGWLRNWNSHGIDLVRYMVGEFGAVTGRLHPDRARGMNADDAYVMNFVLTGGMQGTMSGTCRSWDFLAQTRLIGADKTAMLDAGNSAAERGLHVSDATGRHRLVADEALLSELHRGVGGTKPRQGLPPPSPGNYHAIHSGDGSFLEQVALCTAFRRRIFDRNYRNTALASFEDGLAALKVIDAVERADRAGRWIDLT